MKSSINEQVSGSPLVWIATALLAGIVLANLLVHPLLTWAELSALALVAALILHRLRPGAPYALLLLPVFICLGAARYQAVQPGNSASALSNFNELDRKVYVTGMLAEPPDVRDSYTNLRLKVSAVDLGAGDLPVDGDLLVVLSNPYVVKYGEILRVRGYLKTPKESEDFSYKDILALQGIHSTLSTPNLTILPGNEANRLQALMYRIHDSLVKRVYSLFPDPEASLVAGILFGADKNIPAKIQQAFKDTGTAHIIAISGFNIAIVAAVLIFLSSKLFGRKWGSLLAILGIIFYTVLVGASPSVVRAAIMGSLSVIGVLFKRRNLALNSLFIAAGLMALFNPLVLWDVGFQLSFAATLGLVFYAQPMQDYVSAFLVRFFPAESVAKFVEPFTGYFLLTFAAQLATLPISFYNFGRFSLVAFIANPLILPAQPALMILSGAGVVLSKLYHPLGQLVAWLGWLFAAYTIRAVEYFASIPGGVINLREFSLLAVLVFYAVLLGATFTWLRFKQIAVPTTLAATLALLAFFTWRAVFNMPDGRLHVLFLDVGSSDGILITTPGGRHFLINGGASSSVLADQLGRRMPFFSRGLDTLVVASTQENQVAALPRTLLQYHPQSVLWAGNVQASFSSRQLKLWLSSNHIPLRLAEKDSEYDLGDGVILHVLAVSTRGAVLGIEMGGFKIILPIGVNDDSFTQLNNGADLGPVTALLLSESGYAPSNPPAWLANLNPQMTILSVAADNPEGLPSPAVVATLENSNLLRTDRYGWIDLSSDGKQQWITSQYK